MDKRLEQLESDLQRIVDLDHRLYDAQDRVGSGVPFKVPELHVLMKLLHDTREELHLQIEAAKMDYLAVVIPEQYKKGGRRLPPEERQVH